MEAVLGGGSGAGLELGVFGGDGGEAHVEERDRCLDREGERVVAALRPSVRRRLRRLLPSLHMSPRRALRWDPEHLGGRGARRHTRKEESSGRRSSSTHEPSPPSADPCPAHATRSSHERASLSPSIHTNMHTHPAQAGSVALLGCGAAMRSGRAHLENPAGEHAGQAAAVPHGVV